MNSQVVPLQRRPFFIVLFSLLYCLSSVVWSFTPLLVQDRKTIITATLTNLDMSSATVEEKSSSSSSETIKLLGVCGGIGSGKSTACQLLVSELNCMAHIDSDSIAHTVYEPGSIAIQEIVNEFGSDLLLDGGVLDRKKLGSIVFSDNEKMKKLEQIVWPHVQNKINIKIDEIKSQCRQSSSSKTKSSIPVIIVEAAVLLDAGWQNFLDGIWVITVSDDVACQRLQTNRGYSIEDAKSRIQAQQSRRGIGNLEHEINNNVVTAIIDNSSTLDNLKTNLAKKLIDPSAWY